MCILNTSKILFTYFVYILLFSVDVLRGGVQRFGPPGFKFRLCIVFSLKLENTKNINIQHGKFNGSPHRKNSKNRH